MGSVDGMDRVFSLFRVFDIAFFVPGTVLFLAFYVGGLIEVDECATQLTSTEGFLGLILGIGAIYTLGLLTHALRESLALPVAMWRKKPQKQHWYQRLAECSSVPLTLYFWYLRATCWNLSFAIGIAGLFLWLNNWDPTHWPLYALVPLACASLWQFGRRYDQALRNSLESAPVCAPHRPIREGDTPSLSEETPGDSNGPSEVHD